MRTEWMTEGLLSNVASDQVLLRSMQNPRLMRAGTLGWVGFVPELVSLEKRVYNHQNAYGCVILGRCR